MAGAVRSTGTPLVICSNVTTDHNQFYNLNLACPAMAGAANQALALPVDRCIAA